MKGDFSRNTFDARNHFSRVLLQQGRVQLDADWNEQASILLHYLQTLAADLMGPYGGPDRYAGFEIFSDPTLENDFLIGPGHYYVDGILCEIEADTLRIDSATNDEPPILTVPRLDLDNRPLAERDWIEIQDENGWHSARVSKVESPPGKITVNLSEAGDQLSAPVRLKRLVTYGSQRNNSDTAIEGKGDFLVYLDVWEQHVTAIEDGRIREIALGGPDTATRAKVVSQVRVTAPPDDSGGNWVDSDCTTIRNQWHLWLDAWRAKADGRLKVRLDPGQVKPDPCTIAPSSAYRGQENQLYRIEIHVGSNQKDKNDNPLKPSFKWSRDNGSVAAAWLGKTNEGALLVSNTHGFGAGQWVEITDNDHDLLASPGDFFKISRVEGGALYLEESSTRIPDWNADQLQKVRRWDQTENAKTKLPTGAVEITEPKTDDDWFDLENGLQIQFPAGGHYRTGDYWLIPARTTGTIEWPNNVDDPQAPHGIIHHYAPLRIITFANKRVTRGENDLRNRFALIGCP